MAENLKEEVVISREEYAELVEKAKHYNVLLKAYNLLMENSAQEYVRNLNDRCLAAAEKAVAAEAESKK